MANANEIDIWDVPISEPKRRMSDYSFTIYGQPKFGKSGFASCFPNALFFGFEAGQNALRVRQVPIKDWMDFRGYVDKLVMGQAKGRAVPYRNFILDTADIAWKYCKNYVCKKNGWADPSEAEWGAGWSAVADEWFSQLDRLEKLGTVDDPCRVINLCHHAEKEFKPKNKPKYTKIIPDIPKGGRAVIVDKVDFIIYCDVQTIDVGDGKTEERRRLYLRDYGEFEAGSRLRYMPDYIDFGDSNEEAYNNFLKAFNEAVEKEFGDGSNIEIAETSNTKHIVGDALDNAKIKDLKVDTPPVEIINKEINNAITEHEPSSTPDKINEIINDGKGEEDKQEYDIADLKKQLESKSMELYKSGKKSPVELVALIKGNTTVNKISEITDIGEAIALLEAFNG